MEGPNQKIESNEPESLEGKKDTDEVSDKETVTKWVSSNACYCKVTIKVISLPITVGQHEHGKSGQEEARHGFQVVLSRRAVQI